MAELHHVLLYTFCIPTTELHHVLLVGALCLEALTGLSNGHTHVSRAEAIRGVNGAQIWHGASEWEIQPGRRVMEAHLLEVVSPRRVCRRVVGADLNPLVGFAVGDLHYP